MDNVVVNGGDQLWHIRKNASAQPIDLAPGIRTPLAEPQIDLLGLSRKPVLLEPLRADR